MWQVVSQNTCCLSSCSHCPHLFAHRNHYGHDSIGDNTISILSTCILAGLVMELRDFEIRKWAEAGNLYPYNPLHVNPASIDLTLSHTWIDLYKPDVLNQSEVISIYAPSLRTFIHNFLFPWDRHPTAILASTEEWMRIHPNMAAQIKLKTTPTREGLGHPIADWIDPGYYGKLTMMLTANKDIHMPVGMRICQLILKELAGPVETPYDRVGHYVGQYKPTLSWRVDHDN